MHLGISIIFVLVVYSLTYYCLKIKISNQLTVCSNGLALLPCLFLLYRPAISLIYPTIQTPDVIEINEDAPTPRKKRRSSSSSSTSQNFANSFLNISKATDTSSLASLHTPIVKRRMSTSNVSAKTSFPHNVDTPLSILKVWTKN